MNKKITILLLILIGIVGYLFWTTGLSTSLKSAISDVINKEKAQITSQTQEELTQTSTAQTSTQPEQTETTETEKEKIIKVEEGPTITIGKEPQQTKTIITSSSKQKKLNEIAERLKEVSNKIQVLKGKINKLAQAHTSRASLLVTATVASPQKETKTVLQSRAQKLNQIAQKINQISKQVKILKQKIKQLAERKAQGIGKTNLNIRTSGASTYVLLSDTMED